MIRVVLDTNILVSALLRTEGKQAQILQQASGAFEWLVSEFILSELVSVLGRRRIQAKYPQQVTPALRGSYLVRIRETTTIVSVETRLPKVVTDPKDEMVLATAVDGQANYLVTGDRHLLSLRTFRGIEMVTPEQFLGILKSQ